MLAYKPHTRIITSWGRGGTVIQLEHEHIHKGKPLRWYTVKLDNMDYNILISETLLSVEKEVNHEQH